MTSIGLVLGAGGVLGFAYEIGALAALEEATGWDSRTAAVIVGTSAGANLAATIRAGISSSDHYAHSQREPLTAEVSAIVRPRIRRSLRPTAPWLVAPALYAKGPVRWGLFAGLLPTGRVSTKPIGDRVRNLVGESWPDEPTWICATRLRDGRRVVFGRDDVSVPDLGVAVEASSSIPGRLAPVKIGNDRFIDGGTYSPTNADVVAKLGLDMVIVVSPMSAVSTQLGARVDRSPRALAARRLGREVQRVRSRGTTVLSIQPAATDLDTIGLDPLDRSRAPAVAAAARESVAAFLADERTRERVEMLRGATAP
jgi:NTE family protein